MTMNRKDFLKSLGLGALVLPGLIPSPTKLILTGGWIPNGIDTDFRVARDGTIRYVGSGRDYSVLDLHRWLCNLADQAEASGGDLLDITDPTPSLRRTDYHIELINGYNIDDDTAKHLYDGSIVQNEGKDIWDGVVEYSVHERDPKKSIERSVIGGEAKPDHPFGRWVRGNNIVVTT